MQTLRPLIGAIEDPSILKTPADCRLATLTKGSTRATLNRVAQANDDYAVVLKDKVEVDEPSSLDRHAEMGCR
jgi:hypothetical protein